MDSFVSGRKNEVTITASYSARSLDQGPPKLNFAASTETGLKSNSLFNITFNVKQHPLNVFYKKMEIFLVNEHLVSLGESRYIYTGMTSSVV